MVQRFALAQTHYVINHVYTYKILWEMESVSTPKGLWIVYYLYTAR